MLLLAAPGGRSLRFYLFVRLLSSFASPSHLSSRIAIEDVGHRCLPTAHRKASAPPRPPSLASSSPPLVPCNPRGRTPAPTCPLSIAGEREQRRSAIANIYTCIIFYYQLTQRNEYLQSCLVSLCTVFKTVKSGNVVIYQLIFHISSHAKVSC
jgi:hypothetical protein